MKICRYLFGLLFLLTSIIYSQEHEGIHQRDAERFSPNVKALSKFDPSGKGIIPLKINAAKQLSKAVFGYLPDWEYSNAKNNLRYDLLTHIAAFDFNVSGSGSISNPSGWPWTDIINAAHSNGVKVVMVAVNFDKDNIHSLLTNETNKQNFISNVKSIISTYSLDGVNLDFESPYSADRGSLMNNFVKSVADSIHSAFPGKEVSFAGPAVNWGNHWDLSGLAASLDYIFIMGYDFYGSWSSTTGPTAPLTGDSYNITNTVLTQYGSVTQNNPEKLILGVPYYALKWTAEDQNENSNTISFISYPRYRDVVGSADVYGSLWSSKYKTPWIRWNNGQWNQIWYDNDSSLGLKYDLAIANNLKGVGMFALNYDGTRQELWNLIDLKFGGGTIPVPAKPENFRVTAENDSTLRLQYSVPTYAAGYKIFMSKDGVTFGSPISVNENDILVEGLSSDSAYFFKVEAFNSSGSSNATEVLGAVPNSSKPRILIVNGFDRTSGKNNTFNYIRQYSNPIINNGYKFASTSNEAVFKGKIAISTYPIVIWMLGDESTADETFNSIEQDSVKGFLERGGMLFVSGSEVGWDLQKEGGSNDTTFYHQYLKANYIDDAPNGQKATYYLVEPVSGSIFTDLQTTNFDNGTHGTFDIDWPDAISAMNGSANILKYVGVSLSSGGAGIAFDGTFPSGLKPGRLVYLAVPFETFYPESKRISMMHDVLSFFATPVSVNDGENKIPSGFVLNQNYPNPFNPSTTISFNLPTGGNAKIQIYNSIGQLVWLNQISNISSGLQKVVWNGIDNSGREVSSGNYIYRVIFTDFSGKSFYKSGKMTLLK